jgi:hypothetical protein
MGCASAWLRCRRTIRCAAATDAPLGSSMACRSGRSHSRTVYLTCQRDGRLGPWLLDRPAMGWETGQSEQGITGGQGAGWGVPVRRIIDGA